MRRGSLQRGYAETFHCIFSRYSTGRFVEFIKLWRNNNKNNSSISSSSSSSHTQARNLQRGRAETFQCIFSRYSTVSPTGRFVEFIKLWRNKNNNNNNNSSSSSSSSSSSHTQAEICSNDRYPHRYIYGTCLSVQCQLSPPQHKLHVILLQFSPGLFQPTITVRTGRIICTERNASFVQ